MNQQEKYGDSYEMLSSVSRRVYETGNGVEWPEELPFQSWDDVL